MIVLVNPPTRPFVPALIRNGIDLDRLLIVEASQKPDFMMAFLTLVRARACTAVVAWQPKQTLSYTELRKLHLASMEGEGLCFLFRMEDALKQSSPAALRIHLQPDADWLTVSVQKQRGMLGVAGAEAQLPVPKAWRGGFLWYELTRPAVRAPVKPKESGRHLRSV